MPRTSAGILLFRKSTHGIEFLLVHPGGPFWTRKDEHSWSIPKGEIENKEETGKAEEIEKTARREFEEETGMAFHDELVALPSVKTSSGKVIYPFLGKGDFDPALLKSNSFEMEWPPKSGRMQAFPEVDKADWFDPDTAKEKINKGQIRIIDSALSTLPLV